MDIIISTTAVDNKIKFSINEDSQSQKEVSNLIVKKLEQMKALTQVYKKYAHDELEKIAKGEKIAYGQAKTDQSSQQAKTDIQKEEKSISEENFNFNDPSEGNELDSLLNGDVSVDFGVEEPSNQALSERLKKLSSAGTRGSED
jgi:hypothetical protein